MLVLEDGAFLYFLSLLFTGSLAIFLYVLCPEADEPDDFKCNGSSHPVARRMQKTSSGSYNSVSTGGSPRSVSTMFREQGAGGGGEVLPLRSPKLIAREATGQLSPKRVMHYPADSSVPQRCARSRSTGHVSISEPASSSCAQGERRLSAASSGEAPSSPIFLRNIIRVETPRDKKEDKRETKRDDKTSSAQRLAGIKMKHPSAKNLRQQSSGSLFYSHVVNVTVGQQKLQNKAVLKGLMCKSM